MEKVYPWCPERFRGSVAKKKAIYEYFKKVQYPVEMWKKLPQDRTLRAVDSVLDLLLQGKWVFAVSQSNKLLQALALICPMTYTLTTMLPSYSVSTKVLMQLSLIGNDGFEWGSVDALRDARRANLLVWTDMLGKVPGSDKFTGNFYSLVGDRILKKKPMLFTASYTQRMPKNRVGKLIEAVEKIVGAGVASVIGEMCVFKDFVPDGEAAAFGRIMP